MDTVYDKFFLRQFCRFAQVGFAGFVVNAGLVEFFAKYTGPLWAQTIAFPAAATVTWWLNRRYTFSPSSRLQHDEWLRYMLANSVGWCINNGAYIITVFALPVAYVHPTIAVAVGSVLGLFFNFSMSRIFVFHSGAGK